MAYKLISLFLLVIFSVAAEDTTTETMGNTIVVTPASPCDNLEQLAGYINLDDEQRNPVIYERRIPNANPRRQWEDYRGRGHLVDFSSTGNVRSNLSRNDQGDENIQINLSGEISYCERNPVDTSIVAPPGIYSSQGETFNYNFQTTELFESLHQFPNISENEKSLRPYCQNIPMDEPFSISKGNIFDGRRQSVGIKCTRPNCRAVILNKDPDPNGGSTTTDLLLINRDPYTGNEIKQLVTNADHIFLSDEEDSELPVALDKIEGIASCDPEEREATLKRLRRERRESPRWSRNRRNRNPLPAPEFYFGGPYNPRVPSSQIETCSRAYLEKNLKSERIAEELRNIDQNESSDSALAIVDKPYQSIGVANYLGASQEYQQLCPPDDLYCEPSVYNLYDTNTSISHQDLAVNISIQGETNRCRYYPSAERNTHRFCQGRSVGLTSIGNLCRVDNIHRPDYNSGVTCSDNPFNQSFNIPYSNVQDANFTDIAVSCEAPDCKAYIFQPEATAFDRVTKAYTMNNVLIVRQLEDGSQTSQLILNGRSVQIYNGDERDNVRKNMQLTSCEEALTADNFRATEVTSQAPSFGVGPGANRNGPCP